MYFKFSMIKCIMYKINNKWGNYAPLKPACI